MLVAVSTLPTVLTVLSLWLLVSEPGLGAFIPRWQLPLLVLALRLVLLRLAPALEGHISRSVHWELFTRQDHSARRRRIALGAFRLLYLDLFVLAAACFILILPAPFAHEFRWGVAMLGCMWLGTWAREDGVAAWLPRFFPAWWLCCGLLATASLSACVHPAINPVLRLGPVYVVMSLTLCFLEWAFLRQRSDERVLQTINVLQVMLLLRPALGAVQLLAAAPLWLFIAWVARPKAAACECDYPGPDCGLDCVWRHVQVHVPTTKLVPNGARNPVACDGLQVCELRTSPRVSWSWLECIEADHGVRWVDVDGVPFLPGRAGVAPEVLRHQTSIWAGTWHIYSCSDWLRSGAYKSPNPALVAPLLIKAGRNHRRLAQVWEPLKLLVFLSFWAYKLLLLGFGDPSGWAWAASLLPLALYAASLERKKHSHVLFFPKVSLQCLWMYPYFQGGSAVRPPEKKKQPKARGAETVQYLWLHPHNPHAFPARPDEVPYCLWMSPDYGRSIGWPSTAAGCIRSRPSSEIL